MKAQTAFVRTDSAVKFNPVASIDLYFAGIINPRYSKDDRSFWFNHAFQNTGFP